MVLSASCETDCWQRFERNLNEYNPAPCCATPGISRWWSTSDESCIYNSATRRTPVNRAINSDVTVATTLFTRISQIEYAQYWYTSSIILYAFISKLWISIYALLLIITRGFDAVDTRSGNTVETDDIIIKQRD